MSDENTTPEKHEQDENVAESDAVGADAAEKSEARRKSPLEMIRERQAMQQASRRGIGKKGAREAGGSGGAAGAEGASKPVQVKRQMGG